MEQFFSFRNFRQFARTRREIGFPYDLLNDVRFRQLGDPQKAHLICLLLLAGRMDNVLPNRPLKLAHLIGATEPIDLGPFGEFLDFAQVERPTGDDRRASRRIADGVRAAVLARDGGRCRRCHRATTWKWTT